MRRRWSTIAAFSDTRVRGPRARTAAIVVAVVHLQLPAQDLVAIEIAHRVGGLIDVGILQETEAFGFAGLLVGDEAEVQDGAGAAEDVHDLFFADACIF